MIEKKDKDKAVKQRERDVRRIYDKTERILAEYIPSPENIPTGAKFNELLKKMSMRLVEETHSTKDFKRASKHLENIIRGYEDKYNKFLPLQTEVTTPRLPKQLRTESFFNISNDVQNSYYGFMEDIDNKHDYLKNPNIAYSLLMLSFIVHSGICHQGVLIEIAHHLDHLQIHSFQGKPFIDVDYTSTTNATNTVNNDETKISLRRCYLAPLSLMYLHHWKSLSKIGWIKPKPQANSLYFAIVKPMPSLSKTPRNLKALIRHAITITEELEGVYLSQAMVEYAIDNVKSYSLPHDNLAMIETPKIREIETLSYSQFLSYSQNIREPSDYKKKSYHTHFFVALKKSLKEDANKKLSKEKLRERLEKLLEQPLALNQLMLLKWFIQLTFNNQPSSIRTYHSRISRKFLEYSAELDFTGFDEVDFEGFYLSIINLSDTEISKEYIAGRLQDMHKFSVIEFNFPCLPGNLNNSKSTRHVKANIIPETLYRGVLNTINQLLDINKTEKLTLLAIVIIAYRTGLRIGEILKLLLKDIEESGDLWIQVKNNKYASNKSGASLRRVKLGSLLLKREVQIIGEYMRIQRTQGKTNNSLLFTFGLQSHQIMNRYQLTNFITHTLRYLSGLDFFTFHSFRHSCLSRLQLMALLPEYETFTDEIIPYPKAQRKDIMQVICGKTEQNSLYGIAKFAGHRTPETTFNSYFHFSDYLLNSAINDAHIPITQYSAIHLLGLTNEHFNNNKDAENFIFSHQYHKHCISQISKIKPIEYKLKKAKKTATQTVFCKVKYTVSQCYKVLQAYESGEDIQHITSKYFVDQTTFNKWIDRAQQIKALKTNQGASRHFTPERANKLLPAPLRSKAEITLVERQINKARIEYRNNSDNLTQCISYALNHSSTSKSGIHFNCPEQLSYFLLHTKNLLTKRLCRIIMLGIDNSTHKIEWLDSFKGFNKVTEKTSSKNGRRGKGSIRLELRHPNEAELIENTDLKQHSSPALVYLFHMLAIMIDERKLTI